MYTKILLLVGVITLILLGCGDMATQENTNYRINRSIINFDTSMGVECIYFMNGNVGGVSCNWDKYNKLIEACHHTHNQKFPEFPDIEGRCEKLVAQAKAEI